MGKPKKLQPWKYGRADRRVLEKRKGRSTDRPEKRINIDALFAPTPALKIIDWAKTSLGATEQTAYHYAFGVACVSLIISIAIYYGFRWTFANVDNSVSKEDVVAEEKIIETEEDAADTRSRLVALFLVFAVVIFFWMAFHQNGLTLTFFARC